MRCGWKLGLVSVLWLLTPVSGWAQGQQAGNVILDANEAIFCVLAALNAAGYDAGLGVNTGNDARLHVRSELAKRDMPAVAYLQKFYDEHRVAGDSGAGLGQYVSLALLLGSPPDFRLAVPQSDLPPDAKALVGMLPLLKSFYDQADLLGLWTKLQPRVRQEMERYSDPVRKQVSRTDAYFRFPSGAYLGRTYLIYLDLLGAPPAAFVTIDVDGPDPDAAAARLDAAAVGLDLALLGLGINGHVGFNEPGSRPDDPTRVVRLAASSRETATARYGATRVPTAGITVGLARILEAGEVWLLVTGERKASILRRALDEPEGPDCPASYLRRHDRLTVFADDAAAGLLPEVVLPK
jgi:hypothetical protein